MPLQALELKATMVGVAQLRPSQWDDFRWHVKMRCTNCGEVPSHWQWVIAAERVEMPGGRGDAHHVEKCKLCGRCNSLEILPESYKALALSDQFQENGWTVEGVESGTRFDDVDLTEREWAEYDEKTKQAVEIQALESRFVVVRAKK